MFGIWLQIPPAENITKEGICRVVAWVLRSAQEAGNVRFVLAIPAWAGKQLRQLLDDHGLSMDGIEILQSRRRAPQFIRLIPWLKRGRTGLGGFWKTLCKFAGNFANTVLKNMRLSEAAIRLLATESYLVLALLLTVGLVVGLVMVPLVALLWACLKLKGVIGLLATFAGRRSAGIRNSLYRLMASAYFRLLDNEYRILARRASRRKDVECWYIAQPWAAAARNLPAPLVVSLWDFVFADFPTVFDSNMAANTEKNFRLLLGRADQVISSSRYVLQEHGVKHFGIDPAIAHVVPITPGDYSEKLRDMKAKHGLDVREAAAAVVRDFFESKLKDPDWADRQTREYLHDFPIDEVTFLFNSTQIRPHKNIINLFRAFELLLRHRYRNIKLFITGALGARSPQAADFVLTHRLHFDIISVPELPTDVHAAFYCLAELTVAPTLFEAGMPIMFSESVSAGTPVVMSSISQTHEMIPEDLAETILFDPYDVNDMADRIEWGLDNRDELLRIEQDLYKRIRRDTTDDMGREYLRIMSRTCPRGEI
ncbi:MAG: glycosyltransferase [Planctomycetes bacterium]|nr:glycosyltransferase [Planctomycetota bacterium]